MDAKGLLPVFSLPSPYIVADNGYEEPFKRKPLEEINPWHPEKVPEPPHSEQPTANSQQPIAKGHSEHSEANSQMIKESGDLRYL